VDQRIDQEGRGARALAIPALLNEINRINALP
jgi:hypothetical protein